MSQLLPHTALTRLPPQEDFSYTVEIFSSYERLMEFLEGEGTTLAQARIEVQRNQPAMLCSADAMSLHTDHPAADLVAWYCVRQCDEGGESQLLDFEPIRAQLTPAQLQQLERIVVRAPPVRSQDKPGMEPMLSPSGIYYAQWLVNPRSLSPTEADALTALQKLIAAASPIQIRLQPGQALIINNKRMLHGRSRIHQQHSRRLLLRHWVRRHAPAAPQILHAAMVG